MKVINMIQYSYKRCVRLCIVVNELDSKDLLQVGRETENGEGTISISLYIYIDYSIYVHIQVHTLGEPVFCFVLF